MTGWTPERVVALAPDSSSAAAGQALATTRTWRTLGRSERAVWGECQGSGKNPYQVRVDLSEPAFKCSCPSRKFPCKHALGLLLLFTKDAAAFSAGDEPGWVGEWIDKRVDRPAKATERAARDAKPVDAAAQAKRIADREARVRDGVAGCRVWLEDLVRRGLAAAQADPWSEWERVAARLVDAQAPGVASFVRRIPGMMASGPGWEVRTIDLLGRLHLLLSASERLDVLPPDLATDVRTALGWTQSREAALAASGVQDRWASVAQVIEEEERFTIVRTWLVGRATGRRALVVDFGAGDRALERPMVAGSAFDGELAFYPAAQPLRAVVKSRGGTHAIDDLGPAADSTIEAGLHRYASALAASPWLYRWPLVLSGVRTVPDAGRWFLVDAEDAALPLRASFANGIQLWRLVSATGGEPGTVVAEWDGVSAFPVAAWSSSPDRYIDLAPRGNG